MDKRIESMETLPTREGTRKATRFWSDDYRHRTRSTHKPKTLRTHRKGK